MFVNVAIATGNDPGATIPQSAVHRERQRDLRPDRQGEGQLERRPVVLGATSATPSRSRGARVADRVVSTGSILLKATTR